MKALPLGLVLVALVLARVTVAFGEDRRKHLPEAEQMAKVRRAEILAEIQKLGSHDWAGEYYAGDGLGVNTSLVIAPTSGYLFEWHGCLGLYDRNFGAVTWNDGRLRLAFTFENIRKGVQGIAPEFVPIKWGERHYLIPSDEIIGFCNEVNQGREPRSEAHGTCLLRRGDEMKKVKSFPEMPREYQPFLLPEPVDASIVAVSPYTTRPSIADWKFKDTPVTLDAGASKGLRVGMELMVTHPDKVQAVTIKKVEEDRSEGLMTQIDEDEPGPEVGWRLSTRARWHARRSE